MENQQIPEQQIMDNNSNNVQQQTPQPQTIYVHEKRQRSCFEVGCLTCFFIIVSLMALGFLVSFVRGFIMGWKGETPEQTLTVTEEKSASMSAEELEQELRNQPLYVTKTAYTVQSESLKFTYPDMLQAIIYNNSTTDIKDVVIAFVAWDSNGLPLKIKDALDFTDGAYVQKITFPAINLTPKATFGEKHGYEIEENTNIKTIKAIVVSCETFSDGSWENPLYDRWVELYGGKKLE